MNIGSFIYIITVLVSLYLVFLLNFRSYKDGEKRPTNAALVLTGIVLSFIPIFNIFLSIVHVLELRKYIVKSIFTK